MIKGDSTFGKVVAGLFVLIIIVVVIGIALYFGLREQGLTYYVEYASKRYYVNSACDGLFLYTKDTNVFSVKSLTGGKVDFDVKITSNADNNIRFVYNGEFHYSYTDGGKRDDYSDVFGLQADTDGFTITIPQNMTVKTAIKTKFGGDITFLDELADNTAYFVITVTVDKKSVELPFTYGEGVASITLDPPHIIFGGDTVMVDEPVGDNKPVEKKYFISYETLSMGCSDKITFNCQSTAVKGELVVFTIGYDDPKGNISRVVVIASDSGEDLFEIDETDGIYTFKMPAQDIVVMVYLVAD